VQRKGENPELQQARRETQAARNHHQQVGSAVAEPRDPVLGQHRFLCPTRQV
jgi:hypothetical protein